ncbi:MAG: YihY/virulence factor BrkB family protein [Candidatus Phosphoribacter sp.]|nr:YihY/virulence factor BrkB family protein [Actinomycetales bacterium]
MIASVTRRWQQLQQTRPLRAWARYGEARGDLLAAGIAYFSFFSLFPALALGAVVFGFVLRGRPDLLVAVGEALNSGLPGFVKTADNPGGLVELAAPEALTLSLTGLVAAVTLVLGGLGWIGSLREGLRLVFGAAKAVGNPVLAKVRDLGILALLGVALLGSAVLTTAVGAAASWVAALVGQGDRPWLIGLVGVLVSLCVDTAVMVVVLRVLTGVPLPLREVLRGALLGGVGLTVLKLLGAQLVARATSNPLFGSVVVVVGLLFWLNLLARVILLVGAWTANEHDSRLALQTTPPAPAGDPQGIDASDPRQRAAHGIPTMGDRTRDRVSLAAGAVLGAVATAGAGAVVRAVRAATRRHG